MCPATRWRQRISATAGLLNPALLWPLLIVAPIMGLRDKVTFLAMRAEQYLPAVLFFATLPFTDMVIACKLLMIAIWLWAGVSKFGHHFTNVVPVMMSNAPIMFSKTLKRKLYRNFPQDLRPSPRAAGVAHGLGTIVEIVVPLVMLLAFNPTVAVLSVAVMLLFPLTISRTFPLAVLPYSTSMFAFPALFFSPFDLDGYAPATCPRRDRRDHRRPVSSGAGQPAPGPGVSFCRRCASTRATAPRRSPPPHRDRRTSSPRRC